MWANLFVCFEFQGFSVSSTKREPKATSRFSFSPSSFRKLSVRKHETLPRVFAPPSHPDLLSLAEPFLMKVHRISSSDTWRLMEGDTTEAQKLASSSKPARDGFGAWKARSLQFTVDTVRMRIWSLIARRFVLLCFSASLSIPASFPQLTSESSEYWKSLTANGNKSFIVVAKMPFSVLVLCWSERQTEF